MKRDELGRTVVAGLVLILELPLLLPLLVGAVVSGVIVRVDRLARRRAA
jgi:hypothetical protein